MERTVAFSDPRRLNPEETAQALGVAKHEMGHYETIADPIRGERYARHLMGAIVRMDPKFTKRLDGGYRPARSDAVLEAIGHFRATNKPNYSVGGMAALNLPTEMFQRSHPEWYSEIAANATKLYGHNDLLRRRLMAAYSHLVTNYRLPNQNLRMD